MSSESEAFDLLKDGDNGQASICLPTIRRTSRPAKRRRISSSSEDSIADFISDDEEGSEAVPRHNETTNESNRLVSGAENPRREPKHKRGQPRSDIESVDEGSCGETEVQEKKRKSKYKIHVPRINESPPARIEYATQVPDVLEDPDSSPYRIRGAKWKFKKPEETIAKPRTPVSDKGSSMFSRTITSKTDVQPPSLLPAGSLQLPRSTKPPQEITQPTGQSKVDVAEELANLPSDAFSSSSSDKDDDVEFLNSRPTPHPRDNGSQPQQRLVAPQTGLRQTTLFGARSATQSMPLSQVNKVHNYRVDLPPEEPSHHKLDADAMKTWVYPTNLGAIREYQYSIVSKGLFNNTLVALPTGLGKTFIAATIMLNFFRWTKDAQIVFMAPTKPLVSQQIDACFNIVGIPRSATTLLTGDVPPALRAEEWESKRVFFMTPQTLDNDLRSGIADPRKIALLVVDEAHRATGNYAYVRVVSLMRTFNKSFRVLALTATPGSTVESVQEVIDSLEISAVEIRTEDSIDIQPFVHQRKIEQIELEPSDEIIMIQDLYSKALKPLVNQLSGQNIYYGKDPMDLNTFTMLKAQRTWAASDAGRRASAGLKGMMMGLFSILASVAHGIKLLKNHGIGPFYHTVLELRSSVEDKGQRGSKFRKQIIESPDFKKMMDRVQMWINKDDFIGHPKLTYLCDTVLNHFLDAGDGRHGSDAPPSSTRVIVFVEYRDSAEEIRRVLNRHGPMIRASVFVGQADSKRSEGMNQAKQLSTINKFKSGEFNVLVATSIGEEGLDIGQVDLIVCYDASSSPIRMLQRMGRTGRKRNGNIVLLLMKGKEVNAFAQSTDNYEKMQKMICEGKRFNLRHDLSSRILPREVKPVVDKRMIEIPVENTQDQSLPEPKRRAVKGKKRPPKKFHLPEGAELGIVTASKLMGKKTGCMDAFVVPSELDVEQECLIPPVNTVLLSKMDEAELKRLYQDVQGDDQQEVCIPEMTNHPAAQRIGRPTRHVRHGQLTTRFVEMVCRMRKSPEDTLQRWHRLSTIMFDGIFEPGMLCSSPSATEDGHPIPLTFRSQDDEDDNELEDRQSREAPRAPVRISKGKRRRRTGHQFVSDGESVDNSADDVLSNDDDDNASDLEDFIARDSDETAYDNMAPTSPSSPSPHETPRANNLPEKPYFEPTEFVATQATNDEDEIPDIETLVSKTPKLLKPQRKPLFEKRDQSRTESKRGERGKRRKIIDDDSDE